MKGKMLHLEELYVTNDCRRKGIGKALMATVAKVSVRFSSHGTLVLGFHPDEPMFLFVVKGKLQR